MTTPTDRVRAALNADNGLKQQVKREHPSFYEAAVRYGADGNKQPAAPTQSDAGELEAAIDHCESVCNTSIRDFVLVPDEEFWLILKAARAHLAKSKGGV